MVALSAIGGGWGALSALPLFAWERTRRVGWSLSIVLGITAVSIFVLKRMVGRARPFRVLADVHPGSFPPPTDFSFPSGHAAGSFTFAVFLAVVLVKRTPGTGAPEERLLRRLGALVLVLVALGVGLSRIALGVHFPGDVLAGAIFGSTVGTIGAHLHVARTG